MNRTGAAVMKRQRVGPGTDHREERVHAQHAERKIALELCKLTRREVGEDDGHDRDDEQVVVPMSSRLQMTFDTAQMARLSAIAPAM